MSEPSPVVPSGVVPSGPAAPGDVRAAIARAAQATGIDFAFLLGQARIESGLNPGARASGSSAAGLFQFTRGTWLETVDRHGAAHGMGWASAAIEQGRVRDPALRQQILALRHDPALAALMAGELAGDNHAALSARLGRQPDGAELYLAHFLGAEGASRFLAALAADPAQGAAALFPEAAAANRAIFHDSAGRARSLGEVMDLLRGKLAAAMDPGSAAGAAPPAGGAPAPDAPPVAPAARPAMSDVLAVAFGGSAAALPGPVRAAYGRLRAFGL